VKTDQRLIAAAAALLDSGGARAVTVRAVAHAVGVSHNAPYKHFEDRSALLRAVAVQDFTMLTKMFIEVRQSELEPLAMVKRALTCFVSYAQDYPARYRLLFSDPDMATRGGSLEAAALQSFAEFAAIVRKCQNAKILPDVPNGELTGLIFAAVHGAIDLHAGGRLYKESGPAGVHDAVELLLNLLAQG